jgi:hypothetical protein
VTAPAKARTHGAGKAALNRIEQVTERAYLGANGAGAAERGRDLRNLKGIHCGSGVR